MDEDLLEIDGKRYISSRRYSKDFNYTGDHIAYLCRHGKVDGKLIGGRWYVDENSLLNYSNGDKQESPSQDQDTQQDQEAQEANEHPIHLFESVLVSLALIFAISTGLFALEKTFPSFSQVTTERIEEISNQASAITSNTDHLVGSISKGFNNLKNFVYEKIFLVKDDQLLDPTPPTSSTDLEQATPLAITNRVEPINYASLENDLKIELRSYVREQIGSLSTPSAPIVYNYSSPSLSELESFNNTRVVPTTYNIVTRQSSSDAEHFFRSLSSLTSGDTSFNTICIGTDCRTAWPVTSSDFTSLTFTNATGTSATTTNFAISGITNSILGTDANGTVIATSTLGAGSVSLAEGNFLIGASTGVAQATSSIFMDSAGNVGIGTESPNILGFTNAITLNGTGNVAYEVARSGTFIGDFESSNTGDAVAIRGASGKDIQFIPGGAQAAILKAGGNFGVATDTPWGLLSINPDDISGPSFVVGSSTQTDFIVTNGGNVGIGTESPAYDLDVNGSISASGSSGISYWMGNNSAIRANAAGGTIYIDAGTDLTGTVNIRGTSISFPGTITGGNTFSGLVKLADDLEFTSSAKGIYLSKSGVGALSSMVSRVSGGSSYIDIASDSGWLGVTLAANGGNVGIGTTSPYSKLSVHANNGETNSALFSVASSTASATTTHFTILNNGNVGIGTTTPEYNLDIQTPDTTTTNFEGIRVFNTNTNTGTLTSSGINLWISNSVGNARTKIAAIEAANDGKADLAFFTVANNNTSPNEWMRIKNTGLVGIATTSPWAQLSVEGQGSQPSFVVSDASNNTDFVVDEDGNVGIGTESPGYTLDIGGPTSNGINLGGFRGIYFNGTSAIGFGNTIVSSGVAVNAAGFIGLAVDPISNFNSDVRLYRDTAATPAFRNGTNAQELRIYNTDSGSDDEFTSIGFINNTNVFGIQTEATGAGTVRNIALLGGNVGIGTTTPYSKLSVWGDGTSGASIFEAVDSASTTVMTILDNGNVGIGTTEPGLKLEVKSDSLGVDSPVAAFYGGGSSNDLSSVRVGGSSINYSVVGHNNGIGGGTEYGYLGNDSGGKALVWNGSSGNVGIGTTSPQSKLGILESYSVTQTDFTQSLAKAGINIIASAYGADSYTPGIFWSTVAQNGTKPKAGIYTQNTGTGSKLLFGTSNSYATGITNTALVIDQSGNVGIGTTSPWGLLSINPNGISGPAFVVGSSTKTDFIVTNGGNVGIGISNPTNARLDFGNPTTDDRLMYLQRRSSASSVKPLFEIQDQTPSNSAHFYTMLINRKNTNLGSRYALGITSLDRAGALEASTTINQSSGNRNMNLISGTLTSGGPTSGVASALVVTGTDQRSSGSVGYQGLSVIPTINQSGTVTADYTGLLINVTETSFLGTDGRLLDIQKDDTSYLTVKNSGNVGIGTTSPWALLSVDQDAGEVGFAVGSSTATNFIVDEDGNVGIGVASPVQPLDIYGGGAGDGTANEAYGIRIRGTTVNGNSSTLQLGANGVSYTYLQSAYWGGGYVLPFLINPKGAPLYVNTDSGGFVATTSKASIVSGGDILIKSEQSNNAQLGRLGFNASGGYGLGTAGAFPAFVGGYADNGTWSSGIGLTFNTVSGADINGTNGLERMRITSDGNVGIGTTSPWTTLGVAGTVALPALTNDSTGYYACVNTTTGELATSTSACGASSIKYKENVEDISYGLNEVLSLNPVSFDYKASYIKDIGRQIGFIAEDVADIIPEVISRDSDGEVQGLDYPKMVAVVVKAVQDIWTKVEPILAWFDGDKLRVQGEVCVDDVCVTKEQFKQMLLNSGVGATEYVNDQEPVINEEDDQDTATTTDEVVEDPTSSEDESEGTVGNEGQVEEGEVIEEDPEEQSEEIAEETETEPEEVVEEVKEETTKEDL